jgi:GT2 family glycosyltransferase
MFAKRRVILHRRLAPTVFAPPRPRLSGAASGVLLSIVIPTWNGLGMIDECMAAVREQTVEDLEVIVVDNGSTDGSVEFIRRHYPEVLVIALPTNLGFATAVNAGINASNGQFVALLNNDAVPDRRWAEELLAAMEHGDIAASLMLEYANPERTDSRGESLSKWGVPYRDGHGESASGMSLEDYPEIFAASGGASIYRRAVLEHVGVFDPQYFAYLEDVDLSFRARLAGYRVVLAPRATVRHRGGATARDLGDFQLYQFIKNSQLLLWKNMPLPLLIKVLPRFGVIQLHLLGAAVRRRAAPAALRAYLAILVTFPMILLKRRRVQRLQRASTQEIERWLTDRWPMTNKPSIRLVAQALRALARCLAS